MALCQSKATLPIIQPLSLIFVIALFWILDCCAMPWPPQSHFITVLSVVLGKHWQNSINLLVGYIYASTTAYTCSCVLYSINISIHLWKSNFVQNFCTHFGPNHVVYFFIILMSIMNSPAWSQMTIGRTLMRCWTVLIFSICCFYRGYMIRPISRN